MRRLSLAVFVFAALGFAPAAVLAANGPTVAVLDFSTKGLTGNWWGNFEPGVALSDLLTDQIVNSGKFDVLDRKNIGVTLAEHNLSASGEVDQSTAITAGRMIGARFLISGNILQLEQTGRSGGGIGGFLPGLAGAAAGSVHTNRVTIKVAIRVVDAKTGRIAQSFSGEQTDAATSFSGAGFANYVGGSYSNEQFLGSSMGKLINSEAGKIAAALDPAKFVGAPAGPSISGRIIDVEPSGIALNIGSSKGVTVGMFFDVLKVKHVKDPDSGKMLTVSQTVGQIQIVSVTAETSVARKVSGSIAVLQSVQSEQ